MNNLEVIRYNKLKFNLTALIRYLNVSDLFSIKI